MTDLFECLPNISLALGESPVWDPVRRVFWFVDILEPALLWFHPRSRGIGSFAMPSAISSVGLAMNDKLVVSMRSGVHLFDPADHSIVFLVHPEPDRTMNRLNDGRVGPDGCLWIGSMHDSVPRLPSAALYRVTPNGGCQRMIDGIHVSNGLAWSPEGQRMYHADTRATADSGEIKIYDFDQGGNISNGRIFATIEQVDGLPDGAAVDCEGYYWSAGVTAGCLNRFSPEGLLDLKLSLPVTAPTMPCFGSDGLETMFITSLAVAGKNEPGAVCIGRAGPAGLSEFVFGQDSGEKRKRL